MKKLFGALLIIFLAVISITSCKKSSDLKSSPTTENTKTATPNVLQCGSGYQWDYYLNKCVPICSSGNHNDSITGACVADAGTSSDITVVTNPNNPMENVGSEHNSGMASVMPNYENGLQPTEENLLYYVKNWSYSAGFDTTNFMDAINWEDQQFGQPADLQSYDFDNGISIAYSQGYISLTAKNYLTDLSNEIKTFTADSVNTPTQRQYNTYANTLINYENQIANDGSLDSIGRSELDAIFAVARYSAVYAVNYGIQHSGGLVVARSTQTMSFWPKWLHLGRVVSGDCWGALAGVCEAAYQFAAAGPEVAVPAMVAKGSLKGVLTSAGVVGTQYYNHYNSN